MDHQGHGLALEHPIFNTPYQARFDTVDAEREKQYEGYTSPLYPRGMGEHYRLSAFEVSKPDGWNPIIVAHEGFFTDVPGFENIAEGHSAKMLGSLSLARQGRYFYWGYSADPQRMTAGAKDTFANTIHYMYRKRNSLTVNFVCTTRRSLWILWDLNRRTGYLRGIEEHFLGEVLPESRKDYLATPEGLKQWLDANLAYVFSGKSELHTSQRYKTVFEVDADAKALATPNRERESLETWLSLASGDGDRAVRAKRCLERYVHPSIQPKDGDWNAWYTKYRDRIVFIESTGFWWQVDPTILEREQNPVGMR